MQKPPSEPKSLIDWERVLWLAYPPGYNGIIYPPTTEGHAARLKLWDEYHASGK